MNEGQAQRVIPVETLTQKIGTLVLHNDFLSEEIGRVSKLYLGLKGELAAEIAKIEAEVAKEESTAVVNTKAFAEQVLSRIKAKL